MPNPRVLIVEDEAIISLGIQGDLQQLGYFVTGELVEANEPDLVLMDINLRGEMDGIQAAQRINQFRDIPIIFVTSMVDQDTIDRTKNCKPYGYIVKPIRPDDLRTSIEHALARHESEVKLRLSEARFRELFETSLDGIVNTDLEGNILD